MSTSDITRPSLLIRVRERDSGAWKELVELYQPLLEQWCLRFGVRADLVADCAQETFVAVLGSLDKYSSQGRGSFRAWLWSVARHKILDHLRRDNRHASARGGSTAYFALQNAAESVLDSVDPTGPIQLRGLLSRALQQVKSEFEEKTWQAFVRTVFDDVPTQIVAEELQVGVATVRQYRSRVLRRLRQQLGDQ